MAQILSFHPRQTPTQRPLGPFSHVRLEELRRRFKRPFSVKEAEELLFVFDVTGRRTSQVLSYLVQRGSLCRLSYGVYWFAESHSPVPKPSSTPSSPSA